MTALSRLAHAGGRWSGDRLDGGFARGVLRAVAAVVALGLVGGLAACSGGVGAGGGVGADGGMGAGDGERPLVVVTTNILGDVVGELVGERAEVVVLMPPGSDPHSFEISAREGSQLREADLVVANGLGLEEGLARHVEAASAEGVKVFEAGEHLEVLEYADGTEAAGVADPHFWTDPARMLDVVDALEPVLAALPGIDTATGSDAPLQPAATASDPATAAADPATAAEVDAVFDAAVDATDSDVDAATDATTAVDSDVDAAADAAAAADVDADAAAAAGADAADADTFAGGVGSYRGELLALDAEMSAAFAAIPAERRALVTNHHVFGYLAERFGFRVVGAVIPGGTTLAAPSASDLRELVAAIDEAGVPTIFAESSQPDRLVQVLADEADRDVAVVELVTESLTAPEDGAATYLTMMRLNTERIATGLSP